MTNARSKKKDRAIQNLATENINPSEYCFLYNFQGFEISKTNNVRNLTASFMKISQTV